MKSVFLNSYARNVYSQTGEDGILERIFEIIGSDDRWCVEFGAHDGRFMSNTRNLVESHGWSSVLIEGNGRKYDILRRQFQGNSRVHPVHAMVGYQGPARLDQLLKKTPLPGDFSLLSIDVDGIDYHIWRALSDYVPRVVVIEFNPTIPVDVDWVQARDMSVSQGSSLRALVRLARQKGYELVATTAWNAFFVRKELFRALAIPDNAPETLWDGREFQTRLFQLYDGTLVLDGCDDLLWHGIKISARRIQMLPRFLRKFPGRSNFASQRGFTLVKLISRWLARWSAQPS